MLAAAQAAAKKDIAVIAMTGRGVANWLMPVLLPGGASEVTMHIQESHIALGHAITLAVERLLAIYDDCMAVDIEWQHCPEQNIFTLSHFVNASGIS